MTEDKVKIRVRLTPEVGLAGEWLWAVPIEANDGGGTYSLMNNSFCAALAVGDVVRAELDGDGALQLTDIVLPAPVLLTHFVITGADEATACAMGDRWQGEGANWSEGMPNLLVTVWEPGVGVEEVAAALGPDEAAGRGEWIASAGPEDRTREAQDVIDFELDRVQHFPPTETSYWAADDPFWREVGMDSPDELAGIQALAGIDDEIAAALEAGDHDTVLRIIE